MNLTPGAQAIVLLTCHFGKPATATTKPLSNSEWGRFALWLKQHSLQPADLLQTVVAQDDTAAVLEGWRDTDITPVRLQHLLARGHSMALALEKWQRAGLWVVTRADADYPTRLKRRLKTLAPAVLFGCGNKALLNTGGLAVVGSRNAGVADLNYAEQLGQRAAESSIVIVSGGARGVDESAMLGALNVGGQALGILPDNLLKAATSGKWRAGLMQNRCALVSPFYPEAAFSAGHAMARNKYIYCLSDSSLVVHCGPKSGTISGANDNLKAAWVPLWVKPCDDTGAANAQLVAAGGRWCAADIDQLDPVSLLSPAVWDARPQQGTPHDPRQHDLF